MDSKEDKIFKVKLNPMLIEEICDKLHACSIYQLVYDDGYDLIPYNDLLNSENEEAICTETEAIVIYTHSLSFFCLEMLKYSDKVAALVSRLGFYSLKDSLIAARKDDPETKRILTRKEIVDLINKLKKSYEVTKTDVTLKLNKKLMLYGLRSRGRLDLFCQLHILLNLAKELKLESQISNFLGILENVDSFLGKMLAGSQSEQITDTKFQRLVDYFVQEEEHDLLVMCKELRRLLVLFQYISDKSSIKNLEKLSVMLLGHWNAEVKNEAVILLTMIYDETNWQEKESLTSVIKNINDRLEVVISIEQTEYKENSIFLLKNSPVKRLIKGREKVVEYAVQWLTPEISFPRKNIVELKFTLEEKVKYSGYYDFNIIKIEPNMQKGKIFKTVQCVKSSFYKVDPMYCLEDGFASTPFEAKGRFIILESSVRDLSIHEVFVDVERLEPNKKDEKIEVRGKFEDLTKKIQEYRDNYINCLYIMGALERDNLITRRKNELLRIENPDASPMAVVCRNSISSLLGGDLAFKDLLNEAHKHGVKILLDSLTRISSSRPHRRYRDLFLHCIDDKGKVQIIYGSDGHSVFYEDTACLNYRKLESWDLLVYDLLELSAKYDIDGVHFDNCQSWPQINEVNIDEMMRIDYDEESAYSNEEILSGKIVTQEESGFWTTDLIEEYPNPFLIKITKEVWKKKPNFIFVGESWSNRTKFNNRHVALCKSGILPRLYTLPRAIAQCLGRRIHRNGYIELCQPAHVELISQLLEENYNNLPEGAHLIQSSCGQVWPYPALLYQRGNWCAVDLLFSLIDIPMTFMYEINGSAYRVQITNVYEKKEIPNTKKPLTSSKSSAKLPTITTESTQPKQRLGKLTNSPNKSSKLGSLSTITDFEPGKGKGTEKKSSSKNFKRVGSYRNIKPTAKNLFKDGEPDPFEEAMKSLSILSIGKTQVHVLKEKQAEIMKQVGPEHGFDLTKIYLHYIHRRKLRKEHECFRKGKLVYLKAIDTSDNSSHKHVIAFARETENETGIIVINFSHFISNFKLDFSAILPGEHVKEDPKSICFVQNWLLEDPGDYHFLAEILNENLTKQLNVIRLTIALSITDILF